jgi:hypothetical protein
VTDVPGREGQASGKSVNSTVLRLGNSRESGKGHERVRKRLKYVRMKKAGLYESYKLHNNIFDQSFVTNGRPLTKRGYVGLVSLDQNQ